MEKNLTPQERLERIASIVNKGIYLLALKEGWFVDSIKQKIKTAKSEALSFEEQQIIDLCKGKIKIRNKDCQNLLGVHRSTAMRRLSKMVSKGLLVQKGNGKGTFYIHNGA